MLARSPPRPQAGQLLNRFVCILFRRVAISTRTTAICEKRPVRGRRSQECVLHYTPAGFGPALGNLMSFPTVSVVIPCFNQGHFLSEALESVLAQTRPADEVVVVDDGSTDNTSAVVRRFPSIRCIRQPNRGLASARNTGLRHTSCDYLVFLDADDACGAMRSRLAFASSTRIPTCAMVWGQCVRIDEHGRQLPTVPPPPWSVTPTRRCCGTTSSGRLPWYVPAVDVRTPHAVQPRGRRVGRL